MRSALLKVTGVFALAAICVLSVAGPAYAAPAGVLDPGWGNGGLVVEHLRSAYRNCSYPGGGSYVCGPLEGVAALDAHDGRVYVASPFLGTTDVQQVAVVALLPSGARDPSFGTGGVELLDATSSVDDDSLSHITLQPGPGGTEYVGWYDTAGARITRLDPDGAVDPTFGSAGVVTLSTGTGSTPIGWLPMKASVDGSLTVAFHVQFPGVERDGVIRLQPNGTMDPTFGIRGVAAVAVPYASGLPPVGLAIGGDGRVFLLLGSRNGVAGTGAVMAITPTGQIDTGFGVGGVSHPFAGHPLDAITVDSAGRPIVMSAVGPTPFTQELVITRLRTDGTTDPTFGLFGTFAFGTSGIIIQDDQIALDAAGRPVVTFDEFNGRTSLNGMLRLTPAGRIDPTFGPGPSPGVDLWPLPTFTALAIGGDGGIYGGSSQFAAAPHPDPIDMDIVAIVGSP